MNFDLWKEYFLAEQNKIISCLYVVATPLGNLADITIRSLAIISGCDILLAEDTRRTKKILNYYSIKNKKILSYQHYNEAYKAPKLISESLEKNLSIALLSDAGTPCLSDPGSILVKEAWNKGFKVVPIPGASAITTIISATAIPCRKFSYEGFLPTKISEKRSLIKTWGNFIQPVLFFESPNRVKATLEIISQNFPESWVCIGRELTKAYEDIKHGTPQEIISYLEENNSLRGEFTIVVDIVVREEELLQKQQQHLDNLDKKIKSMLSLGLSQKDIVNNLSATGLSKSEIYQRTLSIKKSTD